jgi:hypothetical protein
MDRYTPIRNVKGLVSGSFYTSLGEALMLSISDRGVRAKLKDGVLVPFKLRKGTTEEEVSLSFKTLFQDILKFLARVLGKKGKVPKAEVPGIDISKLSIQELARGARSLGGAMEALGAFQSPAFRYNSSREFLGAILSAFEAKMDAVLGDKKFLKAETPEAVHARDKAFKTAETAKAEARKYLLSSS